MIELYNIYRERILWLSLKLNQVYIIAKTIWRQWGGVSSFLWINCASQKYLKFLISQLFEFIKASKKYKMHQFIESNQMLVYFCGTRIFPFLQYSENILRWSSIYHQKRFLIDTLNTLQTWTLSMMILFTSFIYTYSYSGIVVTRSLFILLCASMKNYHVQKKNQNYLHQIIKIRCSITQTGSVKVSSILIFIFIHNKHACIYIFNHFWQYSTFIFIDTI